MVMVHTDDGVYTRAGRGVGRSGVAHCTVSTGRHVLPDRYVCVSVVIR